MQKFLTPALALACFSLHLSAHATISAINKTNIPEHQMSQSFHQKNMRKYDEHLYAIAYQSFLANNQVQEAYQLAGSAVKQRPKLAKWRHHLAQTALWLNKPQEALAQYAHLAKYHHDATATEKGLQLAKQMLRFDVASELANLQIANNRDSDETWTQLVESLEHLGKPDQAVKALTEKPKDKRTAEDWRLLAKIFTNIGKSEQALVSWEHYHQAKSATSLTAQSHAELLYNKQAVAEAIDVLESVQPKPAVNDNKYWTTLASLHEAAQNHQKAADIYKNIGNVAKTGLPHMRLYALNAIALEDSERAYNYAFEQFYTHADADLAIPLWHLSWQQGKWQTIRDLPGQISAEQLATLKNLPSYWLAQASMAQQAKNPQLALSNYQTALNNWPKNQELREQYPWFLLDVAETIEEGPMQQSLVVWHAKARPNSYDSQQLLYDFIPNEVGYFELLQDYRHNSDIESWKSGLNLDYYRSPGYHFGVQALYNTYPNISDSSLMESSIDKDHALVKLYGQTKHSSGLYRLSAGFHHGQHDHALASLAWQSLKERKRLWRAELAWQQNSDISTLLELGGMQNKAALSIEQALNKRTKLFLKTELFQFQGQDGKFVGRGEAIYADISYDYYLTYPALWFSLFHQTYWFHEKSSSSSDIRKLLTTPSDQILPDDYHQTGIRVGWGQPIDRLPQLSWRPFVEWRGWLDQTEAGHQLLAGLSGGVLGGDELSIVLSYAMNQTTDPRDQAQLTLNYRRYY